VNAARWAWSGKGGVTRHVVDLNELLDSASDWGPLGQPLCKTLPLVMVATLRGGLTSPVGSLAKRRCRHCERRLATVRQPEDTLQDPFLRRIDRREFR
jgi:hypothetical protein